MEIIKHKHKWVRESALHTPVGFFPKCLWGIAMDNDKPQKANTGIVQVI